MGKHRAGTDRAQQAERTRERLVEAASRLFTDGGYRATSMDSIADAASVTKGALYHHFTDKRSVYLACYHAAHERLATMIDRLAVEGRRDRDPFELFVEGAVAFLEGVVHEPWIVALTVAEGPVALGHAEWAALDSEFAWSTMGSRLRRMQDRGAVRADVDVGTVTSVLNAAVNEAAMRIVRAPDRSAEVARTAPAVRALLAGLRADAPV